MERATMNGLQLEYEVSGTGEPVIFIHGSFIADMFRPLLDEPAMQNGHWLILYRRRRGYGGSTPVAGPVGVAEQAADCRALLRHLGVRRAHVVGQSYGGAVALQLALDAPDLVHSLALLEPALAVGESAEGYRASLAGGIERYREVSDTAAVVDGFLEARWPRYHDTLERVLPGAFDRAVADAGTVFESELPGLLNWRFGGAEARRIDQPALSVLGGKSDDLWPRFGETHRFLLERLPNAERFVLPGVTHFLQVEDPRGMAEALIAFWSRHPLPNDSA
jgi:pimeloyl-ACP methyl ester carboxylesterase